MLLLELKRHWFTDNSTIGELVAGEFECFVLEDRVRAPGVKVYGETAIPPGRYRVTLELSPKFSPRLEGKRVPHLQDVPMFTDILMHPGDWARETKGCLITGMVRDTDAVFNSRVAFYALLGVLEALEARGEALWISIVDAPLDEENRRTYQRLTAA